MQGDSGGPLLVDNCQVGIVSWGIGCATQNYGVYTRIASFTNWIERNRAKFWRRPLANPCPQFPFHSYVITIIINIYLFIKTKQKKMINVQWSIGMLDIKQYVCNIGAFSWQYKWIILRPLIRLYHTSGPGQFFFLHKNLKKLT